jgi:hypothetical protein
MSPSEPSKPSEPIETIYVAIVVVAIGVFSSWNNLKLIAMARHRLCAKQIGTAIYAIEPRRRRCVFAVGGVRANRNNNILRTSSLPLSLSEASESIQ